METIKLSYSSMSQMQTCEQQYWHRKIGETPLDNEEEDRTAFDVGSATHHCVEMTNWGQIPLNQKIVDDAITQYSDAMEHKGLVHGMALALIEQQKASGLDCVKAELQLDSPNFIGFIDLIAKRTNGEWYICDLKTSSMKPNEGLLARLPLDRQLNLYASYAERIAPHLGLDPDLFQGCIYRVVTKSKAKQKASESYAAYVKRMSKTCKVYDAYVPKEVMNPALIEKMFNEAHERATQLKAGEAPTKNFGACFNYFKLCPYFSKCHGDKSENLINKVSLKTAMEYEQELLDIGDL